MRTATETTALKIIEKLHNEGFGDLQIADAMQDGEYLGKEGISQDVAETVYNHVTQRDMIQ